MAKRGRIMRDPTTGPGLVIVQGRQHSFGLEGVWKSEALPKPGAVVDVEFDDAGRVAAMMAVPDARLAKEQAEAAIAFAAAKGSGLVERVGFGQVAVLALLALAWLWLPAFNVDAASLGDVKVTFLNALAHLSAGKSFAAAQTESAPGAGLYGLGALLCIAAPLFTCVWRDRRAHLAALLPLAFMLAVSLPLFDLARRTSAAAPDAVSLGAGAYLAVLAGLYVAITGIKRFLVATARDATVFYENE